MPWLGGVRLNGRGRGIIENGDIGCRASQRPAHKQSHELLRRWGAVCLIAWVVFEGAAACDGVA